MYNQIVGGYEQIVGAHADPDVRALVGAQYVMGADPSGLGGAANLLARAAGAHLTGPQLRGIMGQTGQSVADALAQLVAQQQQQNAVQQAAQALAQPAVVMPQSCLVKRRIPAGFEATAVAAGATQSVTVRPQVLFKAERLVIPYAGNGQYFSITQFNIGQQNLLVGNAPVPAGIFSENATGMIEGLGLPTNQPVQEITLSFKNNDAAAHDIRGAFEGIAVF